MKAITLDPSKCRGCLRCELICSFHRNGHRAFQPSISWTSVIKDPQTGKMRMSIADACDLCEGEETILCVKYCAFGARRKGG